MPKPILWKHLGSITIMFPTRDEGAEPSCPVAAINHWHGPRLMTAGQHGHSTCFGLLRLASPLSMLSISKLSALRSPPMCLVRRRGTGPSNRSKSWSEIRSSTSSTSSNSSSELNDFGELLPLSTLSSSRRSTTNRPLSTGSATSRAAGTAAGIAPSDGGDGGRRQGGSAQSAGEEDGQSQQKEEQAERKYLHRGTACQMITGLQRMDICPWIAMKQ